MRRIIILRGLPGSGKTTVAHSLTSDGGTIIANADWLSHPCTEHTIDNPTFETWQHAATYARIRCHHAMAHGVTPIVIDNCNVRPSAWAQYTELASEHGYTLVTYPLHGWPVDNVTAEQWRMRSPAPVEPSVVKWMLDRWE